MEQIYYCPKCSGELERIASCGTVGYFCNSCRSLVSKSKILTHEEIEIAAAETREKIKMGVIETAEDESEKSE